MERVFNSCVLLWWWGWKKQKLILKCRGLLWKLCKFNYLQPHSSLSWISSRLITVGNHPTSQTMLTLKRVFFQHFYFYFLNDHWALQSRCVMHSIERQTSTISCKYTHIREQMRCKIVSLLPLIPNQTWNRARITTNQHQIKYKVLECTCTRLWHNFLYIVVNKSNSAIISKYLDRNRQICLEFAFRLH